MPDRRRANCQGCGKPSSEVGLISWDGNCLPCGLVALESNIVGMATKTGEPWEKWRHAMAACVGGVIPARQDTAAA